ncbi:hypothetical protein SDC9_116563 [bioreactor metagenome]|uniref:Uncharacterized protein n=1 Tax=bioreactor metagenome TaxID=1076179 RepID=A0A645BWI4_9ZZZZ
MHVDDSGVRFFALLFSQIGAIRDQRIDAERALVIAHVNTQFFCADDERFGIDHGIIADGGIDRVVAVDQRERCADSDGSALADADSARAQSELALVGRCKRHARTGQFRM